jgi:multidrug transporter EmrE-like cation transporter
MLGFVAGMALYAVAVLVAYSAGIKGSFYYLPAGLGIALFTNLIWLWSIKDVNDQGEIMVKSFTWDGMRMLIYALVPVLLLGAPITLNKLLACCLIAAGMALLNFG